MRKLLSLLIFAFALVLLWLVWTYRAPSFLTHFLASNPPEESSWNVFASSTLGFSFRYPPGYALNTSFHYQELGPGKDIPGVKVTIPTSIVAGTNLAADSYLSVEEASSTRNCVATDFLKLLPGDRMEMVTDNGTTYSVASSTGAAAGNRYEEWVWAIPGSIPCTAVRYFIHYGIIANYPPGTVQEFNAPALLQQFDAIRHSLQLKR